MRTPDARELQRRAIAGSLWTAVHAIVAVPLAFAANALVARALGVGGYGTLAILTAALLLAFQFSNLGLGAAVSQWGSAAEARGEHAEADGILRQSLGYHLFAELPILTVVAIALTRHRPVWVLAVVLVGIVLTCALSSAVLAISVENRTAANARLAIVVNLATQAAAVGVAYATHSAAAVWATRSLVVAVGLVPVLFLLDRRRRAVVVRPLAPTRFGSAFRRYALQTWAAGVLAMLVLSRSEIFLLDWLGRHRDVGYFALAYGLSQQITAPADAMLNAMLPAVSGMLAAWPERAQAAFERARRLSVLACGGIVAVVIPALTVLVPVVYGRSFARSAWLFVPLAVASCIQSANNPLVAFASGRRRGALLLAVNAGALAVDVALALALIPPFGAWGAAAANVAGLVTVVAGLAWAEPLSRAGGLRSVLAAHVPFFAGVAVAAGVLAVSIYAVRWNRLATGLIAVPVSALAYLLAARLLRRGLTEADQAAIAGAVPQRARPVAQRLLAMLTWA